MACTSAQLPLARKKDMIVKELENEVLVYDNTRSKAFCLNQTSAFVWNRCDGKTTVADLTSDLRSLDSSVDESVVWFALRQLEKDGLLEQTIAAPAAVAGMTRAELMKRVGIAAALVPFVATLVAPTKAKAYSHIIAS